MLIIFLFSVFQSRLDYLDRLVSVQCVRSRFLVSSTWWRLVATSSTSTVLRAHCVGWGELIQLDLTTGFNRWTISVCCHRFCIGDRYYLNDGKILCEVDYNDMLSNPNKQLLMNQNSSNAINTNLNRSTTPNNSGPNQNGFNKRPKMETLHESSPHSTFGSEWLKMSLIAN